MSNVSMRTVVTHTAEYDVPLPGHGRDLHDVLRAASEGFKRDRGRDVEYDDDLQVRTEDDERLVVWYELPQPGTTERRPS
jgi:hypothetical protein